MQGPEVALLVFIFIVGIAGICLCILDRRSKKENLIVQTILLITQKENKSIQTRTDSFPKKRKWSSEGD